MTCTHGHAKIYIVQDVSLTCIISVKNATSLLSVPFNLIIYTDQEVQLEDVMAFWSGASSIPPMGFFKEPQLSFSDTAPYPTASTCALKLVLPTSHHDNYDEFKAKCLFALQNHGGFGLM